MSARLLAGRRLHFCWTVELPRLLAKWCPVFVFAGIATSLAPVAALAPDPATGAKRQEAIASPPRQRFMVGRKALITQT
jgi:hypothetical protein